MTDSNFVTAWRKDTGKKVRIPARWVDHKVLCEPFTTTEPEAGPAAETEQASKPKGFTSTRTTPNQAADGAAKEK